MCRRGEKEERLRQQDLEREISSVITGLQNENLKLRGKLRILEGRISVMKSTISNLTENTGGNDTGNNSDSEAQIPIGENRE